MGGYCEPWPARPKLARILMPWLLAAAMACATNAYAKTCPVELGKVTSRVTRSEVDVARTFRAEVKQQLQSMDLRGIPDEPRIVLSASLTRLQTQRTGRRAKSSCVVSATLRKAEGGALVAILRGRARAEDDAAAQSSNELTVMRAAVRSAMRGIPKALR